MRLGCKIMHTIGSCIRIFKEPLRILRRSPSNILEGDLRNRFFGGDSEEVTPVPISNTEVKLFSADGTAWEAVWESRTPPKFLSKRARNRNGFELFFCSLWIKQILINEEFISTIPDGKCNSALGAREPSLGPPNASSAS